MMSSTIKWKVIEGGNYSGDGNRYYFYLPVPENRFIAPFLNLLKPLSSPSFFKTLKALAGMDNELIGTWAGLYVDLDIPLRRGRKTLVYSLAERFGRVSVDGWEVRVAPEEDFYFVDGYLLIKKWIKGLRWLARYERDGKVKVRHISLIVNKYKERDGWEKESTMIGISCGYHDLYAMLDGFEREGSMEVLSPTIAVFTDFKTLLPYLGKVFEKVLG